ncbi:hypothetical protein DL95DRAFT_297662 [Leptodontidium sp. 2 PMI_412]|nr:hypothetical protein DL95DRAFT_297662 [Leptodontidium sp. 2 PMI_412]
MRGILPDIKILTPSTINYELEERATVANLLFQPLNKLPKNQVFNIRVQLVYTLAQLCYRQETPRLFKVVQLKRHFKKSHLYTSTSTNNNDEIS